jgi:pimeloyl-ACP methyl ester carboxylesterase
MVRLAMTLAAVLVAAVAGAQSPAGLWEGSIAAPGTPIRVIVRLSQGTDGVWAGAIDLPAQGAKGVPLSEVSVDRSTVRFVLGGMAAPPAAFVGALSPDGREIAGRFTQAKAEFAFTLTFNPTGVVVRKPRPQEPQAPLPYDVHDVSYESVPGVRLGGTLTVPRDGRPRPAVVLITGSGTQDRDSTIFDHKPFLVLADHLTRRGIAVLRSDDRGVGASTGSAMTATTKDFADDVRSAVAFLKTRAEVDGARIGLVGHSEGGLIASMVAADSPDVAFQVLLASSGVVGETILYEQAAFIAKAMGASEEMLAKGRALQEQLYTVLKTETDVETMRTRIRALNGEASAQALTMPWFRFFLTYDPAVTLRAVKVPTLALNGENDLQVPFKANLEAIETAVRAGGNSDVTVRSLPRLNHLFQTSRTGLPVEYGTIDETFAPDALAIISTWILERTQ